MDIPDIYEKIVTRNRGGYCFELNGLFGWLLSEIGFDVTHLMGRFLREETQIKTLQEYQIESLNGDLMKWTQEMGNLGSISMTLKKE